MFLWPYREDLIRSEADERQRRERRNQLLRELRGATPPFDAGLTRRLIAALGETQAERLAPERGERSTSSPRPEVKEVMSA